MASLGIGRRAGCGRAIGSCSPTKPPRRPAADPGPRRRSAELHLRIRTTGRLGPPDLTIHCGHDCRHVSSTEHTAAGQEEGPDRVEPGRHPTTRVLRTLGLDHLRPQGLV